MTGSDPIRRERNQVSLQQARPSTWRHLQALVQEEPEKSTCLRDLKRPSGEWGD